MSNSTDRPVIVYVAGWGRSGSTLIDRLLGELPGIESLGEVSVLPVRGVVADELCGCGTPFAECPFWSRVGDLLGGWEPEYGTDMDRLRDHVARARHQIPGGVLVQSQRRRQELIEYASRYHALLDGASRVGMADIVVDSSKHPSVALALLSDLSADVRIVHIVRDPRGVAYSWSKVKRRTDAGPDSTAEMERFSAMQSAARWLVLNWLTSRLRHRAKYYSIIRYEDLVSDPATTLSNLLQSLGIEDRGTIAISETREVEFGVHHTVAGNPSRLSVGKTEIQVDEAWRKNMNRGRMRLISILTFSMRRRYGY